MFSRSTYSSRTGDTPKRRKLIMFTDKIISELQDQSHNKHQQPTNPLDKLQVTRIMKHNVSIG